jgi:hypothetical protein
MIIFIYLKLDLLVHIIHYEQHQIRHVSNPNNIVLDLAKMLVRKRQFASDSSILPQYQQNQRRDLVIKIN